MEVPHAIQAKESSWSETLFSALGQTHCGHWSLFGSLAIMLKDSVYIYSFEPQYKRFHCCRWMKFSRNSQKTTTQSPANDCFQNIYSCKWLYDPHNGEQNEMIAVLLSNGSLLILRCSRTPTTVVHPAPEFSVELNGVEVVTIVAAAFKGRITNELLLSGSAGLFIVFELVNSDRCAFACSAVGSVIAVQALDLYGDVGPAIYYDTSVTQRLGLKTETSDADYRVTSIAGAFTDPHTLCVIVGTSSGTVSKIDFLFSPHAATEAPRVLLDWTRQVSAPPLFCPVDLVHWTQPPLSAANSDCRIVALVGAAVHEMDLVGRPSEVHDASALDTRLGTVTGVADIASGWSEGPLRPAWLYSTIDGEYISSDRDAAVDASAAGERCAIFGTDSDPLGLMMVTVRKLNALHESSREVQLNLSLLRSRAEVVWSQTCPRDRRDWVRSPQTMTAFLRPVLDWYMRRRAALGGELSLAGLAMAYLLSVDCLRKQRNNHNVNNTIAQSISGVQGDAPSKRQRVECGVSDDSDSGGSDDEDEDEDLGWEYGKSLAELGPGAAAPLANRRDYDRMNSLSLQLRRFHGPDSRERMPQVADHLVQSAAAICRCIDSGPSVSALPPLLESFESHRQAILQWIAEPALRERRLVLWRILHLLVMSSFVSVGCAPPAHIADLACAVRSAICTVLCYSDLERFISKTRGASSSALSLRTAEAGSLRHKAAIVLAFGTARSVADLCVSATSVSALLSTSNFAELPGFACCLCGQVVAPEAPLSDGVSPDVFHCDSCGVRNDLCCFAHVPLSATNALRRCPCCLAATSEKYPPSGTDGSWEWLSERQTKMCPYCNVLMISD